MKHLYLIGGPMGVGKTSVGRALQQKLPNCAFLDGDWCWDMKPFYVTDETKAMVMHRQDIVDEILSRLPLKNVQVHTLSLVCTPEALSQRLQKDVDAGLRQPDVIDRSLAYLPMYEPMTTEKVDTTDFTVEQIASHLEN